jgi:hypothetical protein
MEMQMKRMNKAISITLFLALFGLGQTLGYAQTQSRMNDQQMQALLTRLNNRSQIFTASLDTALGRSTVNGTDTADRIRQETGDLKQAIDGFHDKWEAGRADSTAAQGVLDQATQVDALVKRNRLGTQAENSWTDLRYELDQLASAYNLNWRANDDIGYSTNQNNGQIGSGPYNQNGSYIRNALTGTYTLNVTQSDDPRAAAETAVGGSSNRNHQQALDDLTAKLESPDRMAIERQGQSVTIESSRAAQVTLIADGSVHTEQDQNGDTVQVRSDLSGDRLTISSTNTTRGARSGDYDVTFEPINNGHSLRVTRRVAGSGSFRPVTVKSVYDKTSDIADLNNGSSDSNTYSGPVADNYIIPDNVVLMGVLNTGLSTKTARENDRFTMTVRTPAQYEGAVIEGHVSGVQRSGKVSGRSTMILNFDTIRLKDGSSYRFAGLVESVRTQGGDEVKVGTEGTVSSSESRGQTTAKRAAIGTVAGAIIGAIAGGGKGAAIGATVGAGAGAGSVYVQGEEDLDLMNGTEIRVRSSSPRDYSDNH